MRGRGAACMFVVSGLIGLSPILTAVAQAPNPAPAGMPAPEGEGGTVVVVMESPGGVRAASTLRTALSARAGLRVLSVAEVARSQVQPAAVLTVSAVAAREVSVAYWDAEGGRDVLAAPAPARADQMDAVVFALASALLDRQRLRLARASARELHAHRAELPGSVEAAYAVLGRYSAALPRTNVALRFEDF